MPLGVALALVPVLILMNAFFVGAEYALVAARPFQVEGMRLRGWRRTAAALSRMKAQPASAIGAIQVCITMTNLLLGWIGEPAMSAVLEVPFGPLIAKWPGVFKAVSTALSFLVVTLLTVVLSELLPKALTLRFVEPVALLTAVPMAGVMKAVRPLVWVMNTLANGVTRALGLGRVTDMEENAATTQEIMMITSQAAADGVVTPRERSLILNSLALGRRRARQIMVPRLKIEHLDLTWTMDDNRQVINQHLHSRLPLCNGGLERVIGIVHVKEFLSAYNEAADTSVLQLICRPAVFAPAILSLDKVLEVFKQQKTQTVLLVDEYGTVEGMVTLQDVVDELLMAEPAEQQGDGAPFVVPGETPIHEVAARLGRPRWAEGERVVTVGGLVVERLGSIPAPGARVEVEGVGLRVVSSDRVAVREVEVATISDGEAPPSAT